MLIYDHSRGDGETATPVTDQVNLTVKNIPFASSRARIERYGIDHDHNNSFTVWDQAGRPALPSEALWDAMEEAGKLKTVTDNATQQINNGTVEISFDQLQPGVTLVLLSDIDVDPVRDDERRGALSGQADLFRLSMIGQNKSLRFALKAVTGVEIRDIQGRLCAKLAADGRSLRWDRTDRSGVTLPAGIYLATALSARGGETQRFSIVK